jgi:hypothetical protein
VRLPQLRTGVVIVFARAEVCDPAGTWVRLCGITVPLPPILPLLGRAPTLPEVSCDPPMRFPRGVEVRVADLVWVSAEPWGA